MRFRSQFDLNLPAVAGESKQDGSSVPNGRKIYRTIPEKPADEMGRLIRIIAGTAIAGEKDEQLRARAARRLGISASRAKVFWYRETDNIRASEMDRARELAFVAPIEGAISAIETAERFLDGLRERLLDRAVGDPGGHGRDAADIRRSRLSPGAGAGAMGGHSAPPALDSLSLMTLRRLTND